MFYDDLNNWSYLYCTLISVLLIKEIISIYNDDRFYNCNSYKICKKSSKKRENPIKQLFEHCTDSWQTDITVLFSKANNCISLLMG